MAQGKTWAFLALVLLLGCLVAGGRLSGWTFAEPAPTETAPPKPEGKEEAEARRLAETYLGGLTPDEVKQLRKRLPYRSLSDRLAYEKAAGEPAPRLPDRAEHTLQEQEKQLAAWTHRAETLKALHTQEVERFVGSPGFGTGRMLRLPASFYLQMPEVPPVPLITLGVPGPGKGDAWARVPDEAGADPTGASAQPSRDELAGLHTRGLFDFVGPDRFGHVKDRDHVAGFQPHAFREVPGIPPPREKKPAGKETWKVGDLELVSLLKHDTPAVYVSRHLPRMEDLRKAKTRPLTEFEAKALESLRKGEDLVAEATPGHLRMLGALRAARQCLDCHEGPRGTLLGAFTYRMSRVPAEAK